MSSEGGSRGGGQEERERREESSRTGLEGRASALPFHAVQDLRTSSDGGSARRDCESPGAPASPPIHTEKEEATQKDGEKRKKKNKKTRSHLNSSLHNQGVLFHAPPRWTSQQYRPSTRPPPLFVALRKKTSFLMLIGRIQKERERKKRSRTQALERAVCTACRYPATHVIAGKRLPYRDRVEKKTGLT